MNRNYSTGIRFNHHLGALESLSFMGEGIGAALFIVAFVTGQWPLAIAGVLFVVGAVVALLNHLGRPLRSWRAVTRLVTSWVSRGTFAISGFVAVATLAVAATYLEFLAPFQRALAIVAVAISVPVMCYAGMLLCSMRAIRLWRGPFVPLSFVAHSFATALTIAWAWMSLPGAGAAPAWLGQAGAGALIVCALLSAVHIVRAERSPGVRASLGRLLAGDLRRSFIGGAGVIGIVVPVAALLGFPSLSTGMSGAGVAVLASAVALCRLYGDFAYRNSIVLAGAYEPVMPGVPHRPFAGAAA